MLFKDSQISWRSSSQPPDTSAFNIKPWWQQNGCYIPPHSTCPLHVVCPVSRNPLKFGQHFGFINKLRWTTGSNRKKKQSESTRNHRINLVALSTHKVEIIALITCPFWAMYASKWHQKCLASSAAVGYWPLPPHHLVAVFVLNCHHVDPPPGFETLHENKGQSHKIKSSKTLETCDFTMVFPCFSMFFPNTRSCEVINWPDFQFKTLKLSETEGYKWDQYWRSVVLWCGRSLDHPGRRVADGRILFLSDLLQQAIDFPHPRRGWGIFFPISMISYDFYVLPGEIGNLYDLSPTLISAGVGKKMRIFMEFPHVLNVLTRLLDWNGAQIMCGLGMSLAQSSATWAVKMHPLHYHDKFQLRLWQNEKGCRNGRKLTCKHQTNLNRSFTGGIFISILCKFICRTLCCWVSLSQSYPSEHLHQRRTSTICWTTLPRSQAHPHNNSPLMAWRPNFPSLEAKTQKKAQVRRNSHKKIAKILELLAKSGDASWGKQDWNDLLGRDSDKNSSANSQQSQK